MNVLLSTRKILSLKNISAILAIAHFPKLLDTQDNRYRECCSSNRGILRVKQLPLPISEVTTISPP
jgi:hypothetical protein